MKLALCMFVLVGTLAVNAAAQRQDAPGPQPAPVPLPPNAVITSGM